MIGKFRVYPIHNWFYSYTQMMPFLCFFNPGNHGYPLVNQQFAIEHGHRHSWFTHQQMVKFSFGCVILPEGTLVHDRQFASWKRLPRGHTDMSRLTFFTLDGQFFRNPSAFSILFAV